jgi:hypothetical protein
MYKTKETSREMAHFLQPHILPRFLSRRITPFTTGVGQVNFDIEFQNIPSSKFDKRTTNLTSLTNDEQEHTPQLISKEIFQINRQPVSQEHKIQSVGLPTRIVGILRQQLSMKEN